MSLGTSTAAGTWRFGDITLARIVESESPLLAPAEIFMDCERAHLEHNARWLVPRFYAAAAGLLVMAIQSFLVRRNGMVILVDTCSGNGKERTRPFFDRKRWSWLEELRKAGVEANDVDVVMCSHLHVDHVGWNTRLENGRWVPTFANARYLVSRKEWDHWRHESDMTALSRTGDYVRDSVLPIFEAGQAELIDEDHAMGSGIWLEPTPGHTPGHFAIHLLGGGQECILSGDLMHHPLQLRYPHWSTRFCTDPRLARASRESFLAKYASSGKLVLPAHFPAPTGIYIERDRDHYSFRYCDQSTPVDMG